MACDTQAPVDETSVDAANRDTRSDVSDSGEDAPSADADSDADAHLSDTNSSDVHPDVRADTGNGQPEELKAFPSAYGGGAYATGGRGGVVLHVTNLNDSGPGSFREAVYGPRPATIVFDVSGTIDLQEWLIINGQDLTIAGQTAPAGGVTITSTNNSRIKMSSIENVIIRHLRVRILESGHDAFEIYADTGVGRNIILDHLSLSYGGDEAFDLRGRDTRNVTLQRSLIAESKTGALFGDTDSEHFSSDNSALSNLFYNVPHRTPNVASDGRVDVVNNVTHNWHFRLTRVLGDIELNHVNNYYSMGGKSGIGGNGNAWNINQLDSSRGNAIYTTGNIIDKGVFEDPLADNRVLWAESDSGQQRELAPASEFVDAPYPWVGAAPPVLSALEARDDVLSDVGAYASLQADGSVLRQHDANDSEYLAVMAMGEGAHEPYLVESSTASWFGEDRFGRFVSSISSTPLAERPDDYDSDRDGMADTWEVAQFGDTSRDGRGDEDGDGYTDLEEFLNLVDER